MTWLRLAVSNLLLSPVTSAINILLMALGSASIVLILLASSQLADTLSRDARGIDLVVGAKGSPVQLILSAVYHADIPPGNIPLKETERWATDARVQSAIPLSLGDSYRGFRIVGTTPEYLAIYSATLTQGQLWEQPMEAVVGAAVAQSANLGIDDDFAGAHGMAEGGDAHEAQPYKVAGVLEATDTVIDRLILTSLESVWDLHGDAHHHETTTSPTVEDDTHETHEEHHETHHDEETHDTDEDDREITALLLTYASPLTAISLPREINAGGALQAASPALEISRLLSLIGIGLDGLRAFAWLLILTAGLSVFAALYGSLRTRRGSLAMLRCLGATRAELLIALLLEGLILSGLGVALGFAIGHGTMELLGNWLADARGVNFTGWLWLQSETLLLIGLFSVGGVAAAIPAVQAYRTDVAKTLAQG